MLYESGGDRKTLTAKPMWILTTGSLYNGSTGSREHEVMAAIAGKRCSLDLNLLCLPLPAAPAPLPSDHTASQGPLQTLPCDPEKALNQAFFLEGIQGFPPPPSQLLRSNDMYEYFKCPTYKIY